MTDTKGNIRARKLGNTGITEDILRRVADAKGGHVLAIVELKAETIHEQVVGDDRLVDFVIDTIEPVVDGKLNGRLDDHVRGIQRALFRNRKSTEGHDTPLPIEESEPAMSDVLAEGAALFDQDEDGEPVLWDGDTDDDEPGDDADDEAEPEPPAPDDTSYEVHGYLVSPEGDSCELCQQPAAAAVHDLDPASLEPTSMVDA
jgi:hypothetical protein